MTDQDRRAIGTVDIAAVTEARGKTHGNYSDVAACAQETKDVWRSRAGWEKLTKVQKETLDMYAHKIARILCGNPHEPDHWVDLGGYTKITVDRL